MNFTLDTESLSSIRSSWALTELKCHQKSFNKNPNGLNWNRSLRAMLTYQQLEFAVRSSTVDRDKLLFDLQSNPVGTWQDVICRATLGLSCADAINQL